MYCYCNLDNCPSITNTPKVIEEKSNVHTQTIPVCQDENILNKLLSHSKIEALVFKAKILPKEPNNLNREFIVKCFLSDQSFSVSEMKIQNAGKFNYIYKHINILCNDLWILYIFLGAIGCRFFSKRKIPKESPNEFNVIFKLYVGVKLIIDGFQFVFVDVEDRTLSFMMDHPKEVSLYCANQLSWVIVMVKNPKLIKIHF